MLVERMCWERGCACYDDRVDKDAVEVVRKDWVDLTDDELMACRSSDPAGGSWLESARAVIDKFKEKNK